jgi:hypothetical protein
LSFSQKLDELLAPGTLASAVTTSGEFNTGASGAWTLPVALRQPDVKTSAAAMPNCGSSLARRQKRRQPSGSR